MSLYERVQSDVESFEIVDAILLALVRHFRTSDKAQAYGLRLTKFQNDHPAITLRGSTIGLPPPHDLLWFVFEPIKERLATGHFNLTQPSKQPIVRIYCLDHNLDMPYNPDDVAKKVVYEKSVQLVIRHELVHYLDSFRNPTIANQPQKYGAKYYNSAHEFNAYSNNMAEPLLRMISACKQRSMRPDLLRHFAQGLGITDSFEDTLRALIERTKDNYLIKQFWDNLNQRNRRALVRRLYALHSEAIALLSAYDD